MYYALYIDVLFLENLLLDYLLLTITARLMKLAPCCSVWPVCSFRGALRRFFFFSTLRPRLSWPGPVLESGTCAHWEKP